MIPSMPTLGYGARLRRTVPVFVFALVLLAVASTGFAHEASAPASMAGRSAAAEGLTQSLLARHGAYRPGRAAERQQRLDELLDIAVERREVILALIEDNPGEILRLALPEAVRAAMPAAVQELLERRLEAEGQLEVLHEDYDEQSRSRYLHFLKTDTGERLALHFAGRAPGLASGARVRVQGVGIDGAIALVDAESSVLTLQKGGNSTLGSGTTTAALPNTFGEQKTLVILVNFQDNPTYPYNLDYSRELVLETTRDFFLENSSQKSCLSGEV
jgi:hypothetical protein